MLRLLLMAQLLVAEPIQEWDGQSTVTLTVGKPTLLHVPLCCSRFAGSVGLGPYDVQVPHTGTLKLTALGVGKGRVLGWRTDGSRPSIELEMIAAPRKPGGSNTRNSTELGDAARAIAFAKKCTLKDPATFRSVWGSTLQFDKATASRGQDSAWRVFIPESGLDEAGHPVQVGKPLGLDLEVDLAASTCRSLPMD